MVRIFTARTHDVGAFLVIDRNAFVSGFRTVRWHNHNTNMNTGNHRSGCLCETSGLCGEDISISVWILATSLDYIQFVL